MVLVVSVSNDARRRVSIGWEIDVVRGREIKVRWYVSTVQMSKRAIALMMQTGEEGVA